jgi:transcriptional antiterminator RfaH
MIEAAQPRWYVVQTHPHAEMKASMNLARQGYDVFLPRYLKRRRHARRVETVPAPLFPRYMFVAVDRSVQQWRCIHSTFGVSRLVCIGDEPAAVPVGVVEGLQQRQDERGFVQLSLPPRFASGDKIRVLDGVFTTCLGLYEKMTESERVAVLLDLLGRKVRVILDADSICAA